MWHGCEGRLLAASVATERRLTAMNANRIKTIIGQGLENAEAIVDSDGVLRRNWVPESAARSGTR